MVSDVRKSLYDGLGRINLREIIENVDESLLKHPKFEESLRKEINYFNDCLNNQEHEILFGIRPEDIVDLESAILVKQQSEKINLEVVIAELLGHEYYVHLDLGGKDVIAKVNADKDLNPHDKIDVIFNLAKVQLFDVETTKNINPAK